ncbi:hypothetical protein HCA00_14365 [Listeria booriae]|uniref:hypothetical protein n=1 Tax=Listeria booriae TaxID=1552123 RepID=UPI00162732BC|nr:hypothetical protein [Listeria booriae]MBC1334732.1 hypothetical protein [Listeria booriae]MBC1943605.1 hypothetical protein [Listeria booriae]MBC6129995.1 hypothetical protein [Listeria booriae]MBC6166953.1 hypothetical protein [Listeria booriae]
MNRFMDLAKELDEYSKEGMFSDSIKKLVEKRDELDSLDYLNESLLLWLEGHDQVGKEQVAEMIQAFLSLIIEGIRVDSTRTIETLQSFWFGTEDNPELECMSSYTEYVRKKASYDALLPELSSESSYAKKKHFSMEALSTYSKGVEFIGKIFTPLLVLGKIIDEEDYSLYKISQMTLHEKVKWFNKKRGNKYALFGDAINRQIRNADSHLNLNVNIDKGIVELKKFRKGKVVIETILWESFIRDYFVKIGWMIQGYIYAQILMIQGVQDRDTFVGNLEKIQGII